MRTLPEYNRVYEQQLRQQEQISLQVLDQVQESLSLVQTLYRHRMFSARTASTGEQTAVQEHNVHSAELPHKTRPQATNRNPQIRQESARHQDIENSLWKVQQHSEDLEQRNSYDTRKSGKHSCHANSKCPSSDQGIANGEEKIPALQHSQLNRLPFGESPLCTGPQRPNGCGQLRLSSKKHGKRSQEEAYISTASSSPFFARNSEVTEFENEASHDATHGALSGSLDSPVAVASGNANVMCVTSQGAARARPSSTAGEGSPPHVPNTCNATISTDAFDRAATHTCSRRDVACTANLPMSVIITGTLPSDCVHVSSALPAFEPHQVRAMRTEETGVSCQRAKLDRGSATNACKKSYCNSELQAGNQPQAVSNSFPRSGEDSSDCKPRRSHVSAFSEYTTVNRCNLTAAGQETQPNGYLQRGNYFSTCAVQSRLAWIGRRKREYEQRNRAVTAVRADRDDVKSRESGGTQTVEYSPQKQTVNSAVQAPFTKKDMSVCSCISTAPSSVVTCPQSDVVAVSEAADCRCHPGRAAALRAAKPLLHLKTSTADAGSRSEFPEGSVSLLEVGTSVGATAQKTPCTAAASEALTTDTMTVLASPEHFRRLWKKDYSQCSENAWQLPTSGSPDTSPPLCETSRVETETEDVAVQSDPTDGGNEDQQIASRSNPKKPGRENDGRWQQIKGDHPRHLSPQKRGMKVLGLRTRYKESPRAKIFGKAFSQRVCHSPSQNAVLIPPLQASSLQRSASNVVPPLHGISRTEPPGKFLRHCPNRTRTTVEPSSVNYTDEGSTSFPASPFKWERQYAEYGCAAETPEICRLEDHPPLRPNDRRRKGAETYCVSTAPCLSPCTVALSESQMRPREAVNPSAPSAASHSETFPDSDLFGGTSSKCCCYCSKQPAAMGGGATCLCACCDRLGNASLLSNRHCLAALGLPRTTVPPEEVFQLVARAEGSGNDSIWIPLIQADAASEGPRLFRDVGGKKPNQPRTRRTAVLCKDATSSYVPEGSRPLVYHTCAGGVSEYPSLSLRSRPFHSILADSPRLDLVSADPDATDTQTPPAYFSRLPIAQSRCSEPLTTAEVSHAAGHILCCRPLHCNAYPESGAQSHVHRGRPVHSFCAREETVPQTHCICARQRYPHSDINCRLRSESEQRESCSTERSGNYNCCGPHYEAPRGEQKSLLFKAFAPSNRNADHEQLQAHSLADPPSEINKPAAAAHAHFQLTTRSSSNSSATPVEQMQACVAKVVSSLNPPATARPQNQNRLGTHRSRRHTTFPQPAGTASFQRQMVCGASLSHDGIGVCQSPSSYTNKTDDRVASTSAATTPFDCSASNVLPEGHRSSRRQMSPFLLQTPSNDLTQSLRQERGRLQSVARVCRVPLRQQCHYVVHYDRTQYLRSSIERKQGDCREPGNSFWCTRTDEAYKKPRTHLRWQKMIPAATAPSSRVACCSTTQQETNRLQQTSLSSDASNARNNLALPVGMVSGLLGTEAAGNMSHRSFMRRRLSTASTHAEAPPSPEFLPSASVTTYQSQISVASPQKNQRKQKEFNGRAKDAVYGSNLSYKALQLRKAITRNKHQEQFSVPTEPKNAFTETAGKLTPSRHVPSNAQGCFGVTSQRRSKPARIFTPPPSLHPPHGMTPRGECEEAVSSNISTERCQCIAAETPEGTHQTGNSSKRYQRVYQVSFPQESGDCASLHNQSHQADKMMLCSRVENPAHSTRLSVLQASEAKEFCTSEPIYQQHAVVHKSPARFAFLDGAEPAVGLQPTSLIFKMAAAEAAAILRNDG